MGEPGEPQNYSLSRSLEFLQLPEPIWGGRGCLIQYIDIFLHISFIFIFSTYSFISTYFFIFLLIFHIFIHSFFILFHSPIYGPLDFKNFRSVLGEGWMVGRGEGLYSQIADRNQGPGYFPVLTSSTMRVCIHRFQIYPVLKTLGGMRDRRHETYKKVYMTTRLYFLIKSHRRCAGNGEGSVVADFQ